LEHPFDSLNFKGSQHSLTTRPSVERTAKKTFLLSDRVELSSVEARVEEIQGGSVGVLELTQTGPLATHTEPKSAVLRLMVSHG
jgi:C-terminal processing protease CtpA/Prc